MAENSLELNLENNVKGRRGPKSAVADEVLRGSRDQLLGLLEVTWHEVGWNLRRLKTIGDVRPAIQALEQRQHGYVVQTLFRSTESAATSELLRKQRRKLGDLQKPGRSAYEFLQKCIASFERAMSIPAAQYPASQQQVIYDKAKERAVVLAHAGAEYVQLMDRQADMEQRLQDSEAYFAKYEVVRFCRSGRYRLTPWSAANALAGLPFIGWRESVKRCRQWKRTAVKSLAYEIFEIIQCIVKSNARRFDLVNDAERWLRNRRSTGWDGVAELRRSWYYLNRAIRAALEQKGSRTELPFLISSEYWKRKLSPSPVDSAFEEEERIVI